ncbi:MAG TPA: GreA/GreB family elongation factor [Spirochaetia bacterium]|nr:GreA/GreB family elongation factor [Spirochaetia bacterium]
MSRAFVSESDEQFQDDEIPEIRSPLPQGARNYMTPAGAERLQRELQELAGVERARIAGEVTHLAAGGSNTERDELAVQRRRLREIDRRIEYLRGMSSRLEVIDPRGQDPSRIAFGATVTVREGADTNHYTIVGVDEADPEAGRISWISPVARALVGARVGQTVTVRLPRGDTRLSVENISYI